jgi:hypothetical protein
VSRIVLVTARWGASHGEAGAIARLLAGAVSQRCEVGVVSLCTPGPSRVPGPATKTRRDGVFLVHEIAAAAAMPVRAGLARAALSLGGEDRLPEVAGARLVELMGGRASGVVELIASLRPDSVLLVGPETWWLPEALGLSVSGARLASVPLIGDDALADLVQLSPLYGGVDAVGVVSEAERRRVTRRPETVIGPARSRPTELMELDVAFAVNRPAANQLMVGMAQFDRFVVLLTGFPDGSPGAVRSPGHDYVRAGLGPVAVAEVAHGHWSVSDKTQLREVPVRPSRPNLWKLLAHAELCLDLRPQGILGRETLESLLLGTPVVVPEGTVAHEHAERSNGGLWYSDYREMFDAGKAILDSPLLRATLSTQGSEWATMRHGDQERFAAQVARLSLG